MKKRKGYLEVIAFGILIFASLIGAWTFYNSYKGESFNRQITELQKLQTNEFSSSSTENILYSIVEFNTEEVLKRSADMGGVYKQNSMVDTWFCNKAMVPNVSGVLRCAYENAHKKINDQIENIEDPVMQELTITKPGIFYFNINENDALSGFFDEFIPITIKNGSILLNTQNIRSSNNIDIETKIKLRYLYLYNGFKRWVEKNIYWDKMCKAGSKCVQNNDDLDSVMYEALEELRKEFDEYVNCTFKRLNTTFYKEAPTCGQSECRIWSVAHPYGKPPRFPQEANCIHNCDSPYGSFNINSYIGKDLGTSSTGLVPCQEEILCPALPPSVCNPNPQPFKKPCRKPKSANIEAKYYFECADTKYVSSTPEGGVEELKYGIDVYASIIALKSCGKLICECPKEKGPCGPGAPNEPNIEPTPSPGTGGGTPSEPPPDKPGS